MSSVVSICNLALSNLGKANIQALTDEGAEALACRQFYDITRDMLLQSYPWRFAGRTQSLAEVQNDKPGAWAFAYRRPNDCLKVRWVRASYSALDAHGRFDERAECMSEPYEIEGQTIYCRLSPALLRYTVRLTDPTRFSPLFVDALAWHLSVRLAMPLTRDPKVRADAYQLARVMQGQAEAADANEVRESTDHTSEFVAGRG